MRAAVALFVLLSQCVGATSSGDGTVATVCSVPPVFVSPVSPVWMQRPLGDSVSLNCSVLLPWYNNHTCDTVPHWRKEGTVIPNSSLSHWILSDSHVVSTVLKVSLTQEQDFGVYICELRNMSTSFSLMQASPANHSVVMVAVTSVLLSVALLTLVYCKCRLNLKLWYRDAYGQYEINDGKLYDAYVSYVSAESDRKFVNFILKPQLENRYRYKLHLDDRNFIPGSAELLMNVSRCRRLIVLLSLAYLEQDWCTSNFREGVWQLLEISRHPVIIIMWESQLAAISEIVVGLLHQNRHRVVLLTWSSHAMTPSSAFWKQLYLAMPRGVAYQSSAAADPQTLLQGDGDPMLTLQPHLDCHPDPECDPCGDLGVHIPVYKCVSSKAPILPAASSELKHTDIDVSDLGLRNYAARTDFYCLVTKEDV